MSCAALPVGLAGVRLTEEGKQAVEQASAGVGACAGAGGGAGVVAGACGGGRHFVGCGVLADFGRAAGTRLSSLHLLLARP